MLGYAVITLFVITALLVYVEKFMGKYKLPTYLILGTVMILLAGLRDVGIDSLGAILGILLMLLILRLLRRRREKRAV